MCLIMFNYLLWYHYTITNNNNAIKGNRCVNNYHHYNYKFEDLVHALQLRPYVCLCFPVRMARERATAVSADGFQKARA